MYCKPWNAGLDSETSAVCRRLGRLLTALDTEINSHIAEGSIVDDVKAFRRQLMDRLEAEGWSMSYDGGNLMKVRPPGHKRPFKRQHVVAASTFVVRGGHSGQGPRGKRLAGPFATYEEAEAEAERHRAGAHRWAAVFEVEA